MARPLRIIYPGAFYHVTSRGNERKDIYKSKRDREKFLSLCFCYLLYSENKEHTKFKLIVCGEYIDPQLEPISRNESYGTARHNGRSHAEDFPTW